MPVSMENRPCFIDYIRLMQTSQRYENRNLEIADISRSLKLLAKEMDAHFMLYLS